MRRITWAAALCACAAIATSRHVNAAPETWVEVRTPHFTVWSNAGEDAARTLTWQFEQIRAATATLFPWAKVDFAKPILVFVIRDERAMRIMAPQFWEQKGGIRPASVWVQGADQSYLVVRTDVRGADTGTLNPYQTAYFSYGSLVIDSSFGHSLPVWFSRGLAGLISNTIVRSDHLLLGAPIPWYLDQLRERRFPIRRLVTITRSSPEYRQADDLGTVDAQAWALIHLLMFGDNGAYRPGLNRYVAAVRAGAAPEPAFVETFGPLDDMQRKLVWYVDRYVFRAQKAPLHAELKRERFGTRPVPPAESAGVRAGFYVAMERPVEAQALIAEARAADPKAAAAHVAEGLRHDRAGNCADAKASFTSAVDLGTQSAWAHYRAAALNCQPGTTADADTLRKMETMLARAIELQPAFASAHAFLADVRSMLRQDPSAVLSLLTKAVSLEPYDPWHRLTGARVFWRYGSLKEAREIAQAALKLADSDAARREAERLLATIPDR